MAFLKASTSFTRFRITDPVPATLWPEIIDRLRRFSFKDIDAIPEETSIGWTSFEDMLDVEFNQNPVEKGVYLAFSLRQDTRRVPAAVIKKYYAMALKEEEAFNRDQGRKFVSRDRKKELKEQVLLKLRMRFLPIPAEFQVVWNTTNGVVFFASTQGSMLDKFQEEFTKTFDLHLEPLTPYWLASTLLPETGAIDTLEPTTFV